MPPAKKAAPVPKKAPATAKGLPAKAATQATVTLKHLAASLADSRERHIATAIVDQFLGIGVPRPLAGFSKICYQKPVCDIDRVVGNLAVIGSRCTKYVLRSILLGDISQTEQPPPRWVDFWEAAVLRVAKMPVMICGLSYLAAAIRAPRAGSDDYGSIPIEL